MLTQWEWCKTDRPSPDPPMYVGGETSRAVSPKTGPAMDRSHPELPMERADEWMKSFGSHQVTSPTRRAPAQTHTPERLANATNCAVEGEEKSMSRNPCFYRFLSLCVCSWGWVLPAPRTCRRSGPLRPVIA